jgi:hypothetical protein
MGWRVTMIYKKSREKRTKNDPTDKASVEGDAGEDGDANAKESRSKSCGMTTIGHFVAEEEAKQNEGKEQNVEDSAQNVFHEMECADLL